MSHGSTTEIGLINKKLSKVSIGLCLGQKYQESFLQVLTHRPKNSNSSFAEETFFGSILEK